MPDLIATRRATLTGPDIATRVRALDFNALGLILPNPDPLLKELGQDVAVYRNLARDPHVGACIRRRKAAVKALEWGLDRGKARSRVARAVEDMLADLDMERLIGQALEAVLYGYQPMEITWRGGARAVAPTAVEAKPPEWFQFDPANNLRMRTWSSPTEGELLPERKFLLPRQDPTYANPYGFADLSLCYWPVIFKKGGMRFWLSFAEKFGGAWAIGKQPRTATQEERDALLTGLEEMLANGIGTIPDDGAVEIIEMAGKSASAAACGSIFCGLNHKGRQPAARQTSVSAVCRPCVRTIKITGAPFSCSDRHLSSNFISYKAFTFIQLYCFCSARID